MPNDTALCADLFHTATGTAFADIMIAGHRETWPIRSKRFRAWLRRRNYEATAAAPSAAAMRSVLDLLEARAQFDAPERAVSIRVAEHAGHLYLDLPDEFWRAVDISPGGWRVIACPPVRFRRPAGMLPLPLPERGGSIEAPASMLNLSSQNDLVLLVAWLLATLRSAGPYPLLVVSGEQGSAKTVLSKLLRALVDPNAAAVRALPREERELMIAANNGHLLAFDNLSNLPAGLSDALCRLASGGSFAVRRLYSDDEEVLFQAPAPDPLERHRGQTCRMTKPVQCIVERCRRLIRKVQFGPGPGRARHRNRRVDRAEAEIIVKAQNFVIAIVLPQCEAQRPGGALTEHDMEHGLPNAKDLHPISRPHAVYPRCGTDPSPCYSVLS